jgi:DNA modification methylase
LYGPLGELAFTVLEEGGSLVMNAQSYSSPQIFDCMKNSGLKYWREIIGKYNRPYARRSKILVGDSRKIVSKNVIATYKRLIWFVKDQKPKISEFIYDSVKSETPEGLYHCTHSTVEAEHLISKLTNPNDVVLDPLMSTGTTAIAAIKLKRRLIVVCSIISKSVYTSLVRRLDTRRTEIYYLVISKIVII